MPRIARNPGSGKPPHNGPATGNAGNNLPQGDGWGGPAKGAAVDRKPRALLTGYTPPGPNSAEKKAQRALRTQRLEDHLFHLAENAEREETQVSAATRLHAILNGQPVAMSVNTNVDEVAALSDDELRARVERLRRAGVAAVAGDGEAGEGA